MHGLGRILRRPLDENILQLDVVVNNEASMAVLQSRQHLVTGNKTCQKIARGFK